MEIRLRLCNQEPALYFDGFDTGTTPRFTSDPDMCLLFETPESAESMSRYIRDHTEFEVEPCIALFPY